MEPEQKANTTQLETYESNKQFHSTSSNDQQNLQNLNIHRHDSHEHEIALQIICKIIQRNYSRHFIKRLTFTFIESLKKQKMSINSRKQRKQNINWPFKDLCQKRNRNQDQQQLYQFINLCAQMIQSKFKSYLTRKRHILAYSKAKKTEGLLLAFIKRWKIYRTYNCEKIVQIRKKVKQIERQINIQQQNFTNRDAKKLKGLYKYYQIHTKLFKDTFQLLIETGMWTLEKNMKPKMVRIKKNVRQRKMVQQNSGKLSIQLQNSSLAKKTKQRKPHQQQNNTKKQNIDQNIQNQFIPNESTNYSQFEDRPIKAKGQYTYNELQNTTINGNQVQTKLQQNMAQILDKKNQNQSKIQQRIKKNQQLQKRKKYDPRKAIQQEKKRRKQQLKEKDLQKYHKIQNDQNNQINPPIQMNKIIKSIKNQQNKNKKQGKQMGEQKLKKVIKVKKTESKTENQSSKQLNSKQKKIVSKVDCWGTKKDPQPEWVKDYKARILQHSKQQRESNKLQEMRKSVEKNIRKTQQRIMTQAQIQNESQIDKKVSKLGDRIMMISDNQKYGQKKNTQTWQMREKQIQNLKQKQSEYFGNRKNSGHNIQDQVKTIIQRKNNLKRKQIHRPIQQLEQTYSKHYGDRFQNLMPKLSLLGVTRKQQRNSRIPVISDQSEEFNEWFQKLYFSTQFWKQVGMHEKKYKSFILS